MGTFYGILFSLSNAALLMFVLSKMVPKFKGENYKKHLCTWIYLGVFLVLYDGTQLKDVIALFFSIMLIVRILYQNSSFIAGLSVFILFLIHLLASLATANILILTTQQIIDFRTLVEFSSLEIISIYAFSIYGLTWYYQRIIKVFQKMTHMTRRLVRLLTISNVIVFSAILTYHRIAFTSLNRIIETGLLGNQELKSICFYLLSSYFMITLLTFGVVILINRLFIVDNSMEDYKIKAEMDLMTGTLSREAGIRHLKTEMDHSLLYGQELTIAYIDINDLKKVNDLQGHQMGDDMIKIITEIIMDNLRNKDIIARLGGDEFMVVFNKCTIEQAAKVWMRISEVFFEINASTKYPFNLSASIGFVQFEPHKHKDVMHLLHEADENMYAYKKKLKATLL